MYERTLALIGEDSLNKIKRKNILVLGTGGVGGYTIETLVRSGIQQITIVDYDKIDSSNINRQVIICSYALHLCPKSYFNQLIYNLSSNCEYFILIRPKLNYKCKNY